MPVLDYLHLKGLHRDAEEVSSCTALITPHESRSIVNGYLRDDAKGLREGGSSPRVVNVSVGQHETLEGYRSKARLDLIDDGPGLKARSGV